MTEHPVCAGCLRPITEEPVYEALCGEPGCLSVCWHPACLMDWRRRRAYKPESMAEQVKLQAVAMSKEILRRLDNLPGAP